jgi:hypothetical protein
MAGQQTYLNGTATATMAAADARLVNISVET